jgi:Spy/CpxP family protein refolding chaperone
MQRSLALLLSLILIGSVVLAQRPGRGAGMGRPIEKLALTDEQKPEFEKLQAEQMKKMIDQRAKVAAAEVDLRMLFRAEAPQKAAIEKKVKEIAELRTQMALSHLDHWFAVQKLLTPEQQKVWRQMLGQHRQGHRGRQMGPMGQPGQMRGRGMMMQGQMQHQMQDR